MDHRKPERLKKKPIRLTLSLKAREYIEGELLKDDSLATSISDLLEKIGLGEISVSKTINDAEPELLHFSIYKRLNFLVKEPAAVMLSTLAFVLRMSQQLGLDSSSEELLEVMRRGICVVFEVGYTFPDKFVNNPSALLRCATFYILYEKFLTTEAEGKEFSKEETNVASHECLFQINAAIQRIETASRSHKLQAFKMKAIDGFTISQILTLFRIQDKSFSKDQVHRRIKDGWSIFRDHWTNQDPDFNSELFGGRNVDEIKGYCEHVQRDRLTKRSQLDEIDELLTLTSNDPFLDLLINEVDYYWYRNNPENLEILETVRKEIEESLDTWLLEKKEKIDEKLIFCQDSHDLVNILKQLIRQEIGKHEIPVKALLSSDYQSLHEIERRISSISSTESCDTSKQELVELHDEVKRYINSSSWLFKREQE